MDVTNHPIITHSNTSHVIVYRIWQEARLRALSRFKYISCYCLSVLPVSRQPAFHHSNTSHVIVYPRHANQISGRKQFKYISCYCLSFSVLIFPVPVFAFKYISCYCLSCADHRKTVEEYSNTSHVIVYLSVLIFPVPVFAFKYISCYCLSIIYSLSALCFAEFKYISCYCLSVYFACVHILPDNSNTSHVIVYPPFAGQRLRSPFIQIHLMLLFIKDQKERAGRIARHSNTSHVIVYQYAVLFFLDVAENSNTSHVIVYLWEGSNHDWGRSHSNTSHVIVYLPLPERCNPRCCIQIHLMLLFIFTSGVPSFVLRIFKYISCYCLSRRQSNAPLSVLIFKYISCYCLSLSGAAAELFRLLFKYISCYCLSPPP